MSESSTEASKPALKRGGQFGFQEGGLVVVVLVLGAMLTFFGGSVNLPVFEINEEGERVPGLCGGWE